MVIAVDAFRLAYVALPKAGCSSVKAALAHLDPWKHVPPETDVHTWHALYPTQRHKARRWARLSGYYRFCVVRDPARRLMSCYTDIVVTRGALRDSPRVRAARGLPLDPDPDTFFCRLARYRRKSSLVRHHVLGASVFLGENLRDDYDRVYRTGDLDELAHDLSRRTGESVEIPHANATGGGLSLFDLQGRTIDRLRPLLDEEYAFLSDHYTNPLGSRRYPACAIPAAGVS